MENGYLDDGEDEINWLRLMQIVNLGVTILFLVFFSIRLIRLRHFAQTYQHIQHFPKYKFLLGFLYVVISLVLMIVWIIRTRDSNALQILLEGGGGECINSLIVCIQIAVLWRQLLKEKPYTRIHQIYAFYLVFISVARSIFGLIFLLNEKTELWQLLLSICLMIVTILSALLWMKKRKELPVFSYSNLETLQKVPHMKSQKSYEIFSEIRHYELLIPSVTVQRGNFRIILQIISEGSVLKDLMDDTGTHFNQNSGFPKQLEIVSNHLYTIQEVKEIYIMCNISQMNNVLLFQDQSHNIGDFYQGLQVFLDEYFSVGNNYTQEALELFHLPSQILNRYRKYFKTHAIQSSKVEESSSLLRINFNSTFISTRIFKQLWLEDHYIFYVESRSMDGKDSAITYKRYTDFEKFAEKLYFHIKQTHQNDFFLPSLPKKHLFSWTNEQRQINQRRSSLQSYCQQIGNDYILMQEIPQATQMILSFLGLKNTFAIPPLEQSPKQFYKNLEVYKGKITKQLIDGDYVTFYQFKLFRKKIHQFTISKRFSDFQELHKVLERWMKNTQTFYQFLEMPEKHFYGSEENRHEKMKHYLDNLINIQDIYKVYAVNCFFNVFRNRSESEFSNQQYSNLIKGSDLSENGPSLIQKKKSFFIHESSLNRSNRNQSYLSEMEKGRLSKLIQNLGDD